MRQRVQFLDGRNGVEVVAERFDDGRIGFALECFRRRPFGDEALGLLQPLHRKVDGFAVVRHQHGEPQYFARPLPPAELFRMEKVVDGDEIAFRLRHLAAFDLHEAVMHPDIRHHVRAVGAARLGDLVLVMREDQVQPAAVDVEDLAEIATAHCRAFDMPAGPSAAPGAFPARFALGRELPEHEVPGVLLVRVDGDAGARLLLVERALGKLAVIGHRAGIEENLPTRHIGVAVGDQPLDDLDHLGNVVGRARLDARLQAAERPDVLVELRLRLFRHQADRLVQRQAGMVPQCPRVYLVVDVGDVAGIGDVLGAVDVTQQPEENVEHDDRPCIADMGIVVDRRAANIHAHIGRIDRPELGLLSGQRVVELELDAHRNSPDGKPPAGPGRLSSGFSRDENGRASAMH